MTDHYARTPSHRVAAPSRRWSRLGLIAIGAAALTLASGCGSQRPLSMVRADAATAYSLGQYEQARALYQQWVNRKPEDPEARYHLAQSLLQLGRAREARELMEVARDVRPAEEKYTELLAEAMYQAGATDDLFRLLRGEVERRGRVGDYSRLGDYSARVGAVDEAEVAFLGAARADRGQSPGPQLDLANFYRQVGDVENERRRLRMVIFAEPGHPEASERLRAMGEIPGPTLALVPEEAR